MLRGLAAAAALAILVAACSDSAASTTTTTTVPTDPSATTQPGGSATTSGSTGTSGAGATTATSSTTSAAGATTTTAASLRAPVGSFRIRGVAADDVLNVRRGAGVQNDIIGFFPPDGIGIRTTGNAALAPNNREWWEVEMFSMPETGWVNAQFLAPVDREPCSNDDGILADPNVFVIAPHPGARVASGFTVVGCSRTFESTFEWRLLDRNGDVIGEGFATGGGVDAPATFAFDVSYAGVAERHVGILEVFEPDVGGGEGRPPVRNEVPLILTPDGGPEPVNPPDPCSNGDGALDGAFGIFPTFPFSGARVSSGFELAGCSSTFEGTVPWRLFDQEGSEIASGFVMGGGVEVEPFAGTVDYSIAELQIGTLELVEDDVSDGEGFDPARVSVPVVLRP